MRPYIVPSVALTFALLFLAPLVRGQTGTRPVAANVPLGNAKATPAVELPVTRIVLFNAGIGYFHREGEVTGEAQFDLRFDEADVNDLLKSLVLTDAGGGKPKAITYDNRLPVDFTLKGFAVDVTENPSMGQLLHQVRGEKIEVTDKTGAVTIGQIASVEKPGAVPAGTADPGEKLNLLTDDGLQTVELKQVKRFKFVRPELQAEFKKALELLASSRGDNKKTVSVVFGGNGKRRVAIGYVTESPLWKASYRLTVDAKGNTKLQGWATVENTTDEDWKDVKIGLVAGRPMTFQMDMYDPLFVPRPMVEPELFASLRPPMYQGGLNPVANMGMAMNPGAGNQGFGGGLQGFGGGNQGFGAGAIGVGGGNLGQFGNQGGQFGLQGGFGNLGGQFGLQGGINFSGSGGYLPRVPRPDVRTLYGQRLSFEEYINRIRGNPTTETEGPKPVRDPLDKQSGALAVADGSLGDIFEYTIEEPVTLPRQKSALLPIVSEPVESSRVSIFNSAVLAKHPLLGLKLVNKTKLHLAQGPVAVYDGDTFAGDARLPDLKPGETRLVSYAIDLGTEVAPRDGGTKPTLVSVTLGGDKVILGSTLRRTTTYLVRNRNPQDRTVIIEHPQTSSWKLVTPAKPGDQTRNFYRFDVAVKSGELVTLDVIEESSGRDIHTLASAREGLLDSEVVVRTEEAKPTLLGVGIGDNKVTLRSNVRRTTTYLIRNRTTADRTILVEHLQTAGWKLAASTKPDEQPRGLYRFNVPVKSGSFATLDVVEESESSAQTSLGAATPQDLLFYSKHESTKPAVRAVLVRLLELQGKVLEVKVGMEAEQAALKEIIDDQDRIRKNIERAPKESEAYKRYVKKFDDQETEIEKRQAKLKELRGELAKHEKALKDYVESAKAE